MGCLPMSPFGKLRHNELSSVSGNLLSVCLSNYLSTAEGFGSAIISCSGGLPATVTAYLIIIFHPKPTLPVSLSSVQQQISNPGQL